MLIEDTIVQAPLEKSGYLRMLGHRPSARFIQKAHSCCIRNGNELEDLIYEFSKMPKNTRVKYEQRTFYKQKHGLIVKCRIGKENFHSEKGINPDVVVFKDDIVYVCEIKDGQNFDTKKSTGEIDKLLVATQFLEKNDPFKRKHIPKIVLWNCDNLGESSFKDKRAKEKDMLITGKQFASLTEIDYDGLNDRRKRQDQKANRKYVYHQSRAILKSLEEEFPEEFVNETIL